MKLPKLQTPEKYTGLYVFDFGDQVAVGYTADEIAVLLESDRFTDGKVYRIHRALPDGTMELQGVPLEKFQVEDGIFFYRVDGGKARDDFETLGRSVENNPPPCRMKVHLSRLPLANYPEVTVIIFPAEFTHDVADWLNRLDFNGGDLVEGGPSQVTDYYAANPNIIERQQWWPAGNISRSAEEVLASTHLAIQRQIA